ncbi:MAG: hypothetical protein JSW56_16000 [Deltaproteobacteria bacterium]|nr:MAG: hypothetical protein JSW56_16000 [Deltaproteobacteria bacterium]
MVETFQTIIAKLTQPKKGKKTFSILDPRETFDQDPEDDTGIVQALNAAFLINLSGDTLSGSERAERFLSHMAGSEQWADVAQFYLDGINRIHQEIEGICKRDPIFADRLKKLSDWLSNPESAKDEQKTAEEIWSVFFPEANGILTNKEKCIEALRSQRTVTVEKLNLTPITDPARQILFTSNVLLTICPPSRSIDELSYSRTLKEKLRDLCREPQLFFYDHPIPLGVEPKKNEVLYGLRSLDAAFEFERSRGNISRDTKPVCVLSVSTTHRGLQQVAKGWLQEEFGHSYRLKNLNVYVFTESDTQRLINEIFVPAAAHYLELKDEKESFSVFGVDGEYGRHYSFLRAIANFWNIFIQPEIRATFKIDLDQVFPQAELVQQTGASALEHLSAPLWGARGLDASGQPVELGMIAGALVNHKDMGRSLFTPDVPFPNRSPYLDEYIFFSTLPQALSTEAEMMTRYNTYELDGKRTCIQRIHVTGGTTGILVDSLRRYRPFTPSFIGRAEDQAYILSVLLNPGTRLAYAHKDGLIMRHDKEAFAQEAMQSAYVGKLVADYVRILYFSAYANALADDGGRLKEIIDPFTGCFVSKIPVSVVYLRLAFKAASFFNEDKKKQGLEFVQTGARRIKSALKFVGGDPSKLKQQYEKERLAWDLYYDTLSSVEEGLRRGDAFARELQTKAESILNDCAIRFE